ncbi:MAG: hypothetical protein QOF58_5338 [Pseudonocardiales bacterium]|jgi:hypothetical protein|nr:hypothetical protein [Actinomycetota bacterium]MDT7786919.1 hypothetical protein [Pseudonocardiales bacterium]
MGETIRVFGIEDTVGVERGLFKKSSELRIGRGEVDSDDLKNRLSAFLESMQGVVNSVPAFLGDFRVDSISIAAEVSAKGSVSLLGAGGEVAGKGGITFNLRRKTADSASLDASDQQTSSPSTTEANAASGQAEEGPGPGGG